MRDIFIFLMLRFRMQFKDLFKLKKNVKYKEYL